MSRRPEPLSLDDFARPKYLTRVLCGCSPRDVYLIRGGLRFARTKETAAIYINAATDGFYPACPEAGYTTARWPSEDEAAKFAAERFGYRLVSGPCDACHGTGEIEQEEG